MALHEVDHRSIGMPGHAGKPSGGHGAGPVGVRYEPGVAREPIAADGAAHAVGQRGPVNAKARPSASACGTMPPCVPTYASDLKLKSW